MSIQTVLQQIQDDNIRFIDLRFTDTRGKEQHISVPSKMVTEEFLAYGKMFDGSSIAGWKGINESDMILLPDSETAVLDPFREETTLIFDAMCTILIRKNPTLMTRVLWQRMPKNI